MKRIKLKCLFYTEYHFQVEAYDMSGQLLKKMIMPVDVWRYEDKRKAFIMNEFRYEAGSIVICN